MKHRRKGGGQAWRRPERRSIVLLLLAAAGALLITWLIARNAALQLFADDEPAASLQFAPPNGTALAEMALDQVVMANGVVGPQSHALFEEALRRAPLLAQPLILAGMEASAANDTDRARRLMEEARHRDPRSVIARSWLIDYYLGQGDYAAGLDEAGPLMVLESDAQPAILAMVTALVQIPRARPALVAKLRTDPWWRSAFFQQASDSPALVPGMASLLLAAPNRTNPIGAKREQQALLQGVASQGRYALARDMWLAQLPPAQRGKVSAIYDGNFGGLPGVPPFNWRLHDAPGNIVERVEVSDLPEKTALQISADGDQSVPIADQLTILPHGAYTLSFKVRRLPDADPGAADLGVVVRCALGDVLGSSFLDPPSAAEIRTVDFDVPAGCPAVSVRFSVRPGENPGPVDAQLTGVSIGPRFAAMPASGTLPVRSPPRG